MNNTTKEVKQRIDQFIADKAKELTEISDEISTIERRQARASMKMKCAMESTDVSSYEKARKEFQRAQTAGEMYAARLAQLNDKTFVTEEESDRVIDSLLSYEDALEKELIESIKEPLTNLKMLYDQYTSDIRETESVIQTWTDQIHANYRNQFALYPDGTNRSPEPIPVRIRPFLGCGAAIITEKYLNKMMNIVGDLP